ncbi:YLL007C [Zygosaccharomyces parabailii]|nr:YLL007C [Zygosaccharomyces parabailii]CDH12697.1 uncharacterized protein ZBAI_04483 [Zygosaccharomyces bailii ISA1307]
MDATSRVQQLLDQSESLSLEHSRECLKTILAASHQPKQFDFSRFLLGCHDKVLCQEAILNAKFWELFEETMTDAPPDNLAICLTRVCTLSLRESGVDTQAITSLCRFLSTSDMILPILSANLSTQRTSMRVNFDILESIDGALRCLVCLCERDPMNAAVIVPSSFFLFQDCGFWNILISLLPMEELKSEILEVILPLRNRIFKFMASLNLKEFPTPLETKMMESITDTLSFDGNLKSKFEEVNQGYGDLHSIKLIEAFHLVIFLKNANLSFKKTLSEELLFGSNPFPLYKAFFSILDQLHQFLNSQAKDTSMTTYYAAFLLDRDAFIYTIMDKLLKMWVVSQGESKNDIHSLLETIPIMLDQIDKVIKNFPDLSPQGAVSLAQETIEGINYERARQLQLESIKRKHQEKWSKATSDFEKLLSEQVHDYVRHQRLLQLQKGTWAFSENPLDRNVPCPKLYFMVLSANQVNLLVREFPTKMEVTPFIEENGIFSSSEKDQAGFEKTTAIPLHTIVDFETAELLLENKAPDNPRLVNVIQKDFYTGVNFLDKYRKTVLKVFFDNKDDVYVWLDGLKLVSPFKIRRGISDSTKEQMNTLIDIRRNAQMLNLEISDDGESTENSDEEEYYNVDTLKELNLKFYYE